MIWLRFRAELRARWRAWLTLGILIGAIGGLAIGAAAAARRTHSAYPRYLEETRANDVSLTSPSSNRESQYDAIARLPDVERAGRNFGISVVEEGEDGLLRQPPFIAQASDGARFYDFDRPKILHGRLPSVHAPDEALVNPTLARSRNFRVGSTIDVLTADELLPPGELTRAYQRGAMELRPAHLTVVGIGVLPVDTLAHAETEARFIVTPAFVRAYRPPRTWVALSVRLRAGRDPGRFATAVREVAPGEDVRISLQSDETRQVARAIRPDETVLAIFAALMALAGLLIAGPAIRRQSTVDAGDDLTLRALGMTSRDRRRLSAFRALVTALAGAAIAVIVAVLVSPLAPIGPTRDVEPHPGLSFDLPVLLLGGLALLALVFAISYTALSHRPVGDGATSRCWRRWDLLEARGAQRWAGRPRSARSSRS